MSEGAYPDNRGNGDFQSGGELVETEAGEGVMPTQLEESRHELQIGSRKVELYPNRHLALRLN